MSNDFEFDEDDIDLGVCPYYVRYYRLPGYDNDAICGFGCWEEPQCITCEPAEGWPSHPEFREGLADGSG